MCPGPPWLQRRRQDDVAAPVDRLAPADSGLAKVFGKTMSPNSADLRRRIGYIPTNPHFPRGMTPITYLDYMARLFGLPADVRKPRLATLIRAVDLLGASGDRIAGFSNGMTARLAVATSLINDPTC